MKKCLVKNEIIFMTVYKRYKALHTTVYKVYPMVTQQHV